MIFESTVNDNPAVKAEHKGSSGAINIKLLGTTKLTTAGDGGTSTLGSIGIWGRNTGTASSGDINITLEDSARIETSGKYAYGVAGENQANDGSGDINIVIGGNASITTSGQNAHGIHARHFFGFGTMSIFIDEGASVLT